jgi:hypothetical protein
MPDLVRNTQSATHQRKETIYLDDQLACLTDETGVAIKRSLPNLRNSELFYQGG